MDQMKHKSLLLINVPSLFVNQVILFLHLMDSSLNLERTYAYVRREANHRNILTGDFTASKFMAMIVL
ncbi:hypothetical protein SADUNF_Sadunf01G0139100 [Salix dunnii]|uniref:Uncharacterized protein n=1 Tax=Salix dunnii TaxID=1413687 RepID=A0A835NBQ3_9ROSI|nr:hypothetical protein SADUNF_Sadunf01G0139100 [Salix dunnii]